MKRQAPPSDRPIFDEPLPEDLPEADLSENARIVLAKRYLKKGAEGTPIEKPEAKAQAPITLNQVAERLNITKPALYNYFSGKTEMPITLLLLVLGGILLMVNTAWFKVGAMHGKLTLALVAIGLLHASRGVMKKMITALEQGENADALAKKYGRMRAVVLLLLLLMVFIYLKLIISISYKKYKN